jgi:hypothetical protein
MVLAAMDKWPNVPAVFGWLRLDGRGRWWLKTARLEHAATVAFFGRNYARDGGGRYFVQNGPQRVYVAFDKAPYVVRRVADGWRLEPSDRVGCASHAWLTPDGELLLEIAGELVLVDDRDLLALTDEALADWDGDLCAVPHVLRLAEGAVPLETATLPMLWQRFALAPRPA